MLDLWTLIKRSWALVVALPIVCAIVCFAVMGAQPSSYSASATLVATSEHAILNGQATSAATQQSAATGYSVSASYNAANLVITITASGADADECVRIANETAAKARANTLKFLGLDAAGDGAAAEAASGAADPVELALLALTSEKDVNIAITEATNATSIAAPKAKYTAVAFIAGLLLAIVIVVIRDMARGSIHNGYEVEERYDLRQLGRVGGKRRREGDAQALLAALDFAGDGARALCLVPTEQASSAVAVVAALEEASAKAERTLSALHDAIDLPLTNPESLAQQLAARMQAEADLALVVAPAVADSADYAYLAPACGKAVLVLEAMRSKRANLEDALRQLALSQTPVAGFVMVNDR